MSNGNGQRLFRYYGNVLSLQQAGPSSDGYLSQSDWNRFDSSASAAVTSVFGRLGDIQAQQADYSAFYQPLGNYERPLTFEASLYRNGNTITLLNDMPVNQAPGTAQYYGMTSTGARGWFIFPGGVSSFNSRVGAVMPAAGDYTAAQVGAEVPLSFIQSLYRNGNQVSLVGDVLGTGPTASQYYGTNAAGNRGWYNLPISGVSSFNSRTGAVMPQAGDYAGIYEVPITFIASLYRNGNQVSLVGDVAGTGPTANQYYGTNTAGNRGWYALPVGLPAAGLAGQVLAKNSNTNYDVGWVNTAGMPAGGATGYVLTKNSPTNYDANWAPPPGGGGGGTVMSFSAGNLSPLFITSVATATSTPALSFVLSNVNPKTFFGYTVGTGPSAPAFVQVTFGDLASTPTTLAGYGITDPIVLTTGSYANPAWITSLAWSKITGAPAFEVPLTFSASVYRNGNQITLLNDYSGATGPTNQQYYGLTPSNVRGWFDLPASEPPLGNPGANGYMLVSTTAGVRSWTAPPSAGVTTIGIGNASPLFTASPSTPTGGAVTISFTLGQANAHTFWGATTGTSPSPCGFVQPAFTDISGIASISQGGTGAASAAANSFFGNNSPSLGPPSFAAMAALSAVNDSNVTLTLGGTPATALFKAVSLTLGWSGTLPTGRGGTGNTLGAEAPLGNPSTNGYILSSTTAGVRSWIAPGAPPVGQALTEVDDTNVGLTLGGSFNACLLAPASITVNWIGLLPVARGGTGVGTATGTGSLVLSASPTFTGQLNCANLNCTGTMLRPNNIQGTNTNDAAAAGNLGETVTATRTSTQTIGMTANAIANITSITLTAGDWDVRGICSWTGNIAANSASVLTVAVTTTSASLPDDGWYGMCPCTNPTAATQSGFGTVTIPPRRFSLAASTIIYLCARGGVTGSGWGAIEARRVR